MEGQLNSPQRVSSSFLKTGEETCTHKHLTFVKMKQSRALNEAQKTSTMYGIASQNQIRHQMTSKHLEKGCFKRSAPRRPPAGPWKSPGDCIYICYKNNRLLSSFLFQVPTPGASVLRQPARAPPAGGCRRDGEEDACLVSRRQDPPPHPSHRRPWTGHSRPQRGLFSHPVPWGGRPTAAPGNPSALPCSHRPAPWSVLQSSCLRRRARSGRLCHCGGAGSSPPVPGASAGASAPARSSVASPVSRSCGPPEGSGACSACRLWS